jgi:hypothetical protein
MESTEILLASTCLLGYLLLRQFSPTRDLALLLGIGFLGREVYAISCHARAYYLLATDAKSRLDLQVAGMELRQAIWIVALTVTVCAVELARYLWVRRNGLAERAAREARSAK